MYLGGESIKVVDLRLFETPALKLSLSHSLSSFSRLLLSSSPSSRLLRSGGLSTYNPLLPLGLIPISLRPPRTRISSSLPNLTNWYPQVEPRVRSAQDP